jgi:hypothetical protein
MLWKIPVGKSVNAIIAYSQFSGSTGEFFLQRIRCQTLGHGILAYRKHGPTNIIPFLPH